MNKCSRLRRVFDGALDLLFPKRCIGCGRWDTWLCEECTGQLVYISPDHCHSCGVSLSFPVLGLCAKCSMAVPSLSACFAVAYAQNTLRAAIHRLKYCDHAQLAKPLSDLMARWWSQHSRPADLIVPIPLHERRQKERGYNQAELISRGLAQAIGAPHLPHAMIRCRDTRPQVGLNARQRKENVAGAFVCPNPETVAGKRIVLIDDVMTTGATLEAAAKALRTARASDVWSLTLARAEPIEPD